MYRRTESKEKLQHSYAINLCKFWKRKLYTFILKLVSNTNTHYREWHVLYVDSCTSWKERDKKKRKNLLCTNICKDVIDVVDSFDTHWKEIYRVDAVSFLLKRCLLKLIQGKPGPHIEPRLSVHAFPSPFSVYCMFTPNGKREFVPRDQVFLLIVVNCLLLQLKNK